MDSKLFFNIIFPLIAGIAIFLWTYSSATSKEPSFKLFARISNRTLALEIIKGGTIFIYVIFAIPVLLQLVVALVYGGNVLDGLWYKVFKFVILVVPAYFLQNTKRLIFALLLFIYPAMYILGFVYLISNKDSSIIFNILEVFFFMCGLWTAVKLTQASLYLRSGK